MADREARVRNAGGKVVRVKPWENEKNELKWKE